MDVIDFVKEEKELYLPKTEPVIVNVPEMLFMMIDGKGQPESGPPGDNKEFMSAIGALYGLVYTIKFADKKGDAPKGFKKFKIPPLEGLWWMEGMEGFDPNRPQDWRWTLMLRVPEFVTEDLILKFADELEKKKGPGAYKNVRLSKFTEGPSVQIMHIGPYNAEQLNIVKMHKFATEQGYVLHGHHHELYFSDPRRTAPEKLRTVLRQSVKQK